jgi:photosystem II stability/assembly factor-like uncharacterized protein
MTSDGKTWSRGGLPAEPRCLASSPDGSKVLATTNQGLLSSADGGQSWAPVASAPPLFLTAWADPTTVVGVTIDGGLATSADSGTSWKVNPVKLSNSQAISADRDKAGALEILVVTETGVLKSRDDGATFTTLTS